MARGEQVPFRITVRVTAAALAPDGELLATHLRATYVNRARIGLTRCVSLPATTRRATRACRYLAATGSTRTVASTASTVGS